MAKIKIKEVSGKRTKAKFNKARRIRSRGLISFPKGGRVPVVVSCYGNPTTTDMLDASRIITAYVKNGKIEVASSSDTVKKIVASAIDGKKATETVLALQKLNRAIVVRNARENAPTDETRLLYAKLIHED